MHPALVIAWKDLRQRLRDRSAVVAAFVTPVVLGMIVSAAFGGGFTGSFRATYAVVDQDGTELSRVFSEQVLAAPGLSDQVTIVVADTPDEAEALVRDDRVASAFLIPAGFEAEVMANRRATVSVLRNPDSPIGSAVAEALARAYTDQIDASRLSVITSVGALQAAGRTPDPETIVELAQAAATERIPIQLVDGQIGVRNISGANYFGPSMAIFALFFTSAFVARSLIAEREDGTLPRVLAAPVHRGAVLIGKSLSIFVLGLTSFVVMFLVFSILLDVQWGNPLALAALSVATVLAVMGLMTALQTLSRTREGADAIAGIATITLALVGGNFFPIFQMPRAMQLVSYATPNGWALRGFTDVGYDGATVLDLGPHLLAILAFALLTGALGIMRSRRIM